MVNTVNRIPSSNLPLTNEQGIIHPIWYEFLRSFISSVGDSSGGTSANNTVIAGAGISGTGSVSTVDVGQGEGIIVNTNDVAVDIIHQTNITAAPEDEILVSDASDFSRIRKTSLRSVAQLSPGTVPGGNNLSVQYNNNGEFGGDNSFTTNGSGSVTIGNVNISGDTITDGANDLNLTSSTTTNIIANFTSNGNTGVFRVAKASNSFDSRIEITNTIRDAVLRLSGDTTNSGTSGPAMVQFYTDSAAKWQIKLDDAASNDLKIMKSLVSPTILTFDYTNETTNVNTYLHRKVTTSITASTTQTQGQGALTAEVNVVSTVANANDTVTLPVALAGRKIWIINNGANTLQIFPASGDNLGAGVDTATTLLAGSNMTFLAYDTTNWEQNI